MPKTINLIVKFILSFAVCWILVRLIEARITLLQVTFQAVFLAVMISLLVDNNYREPNA